MTRTARQKLIGFIILASVFALIAPAPGRAQKSQSYSKKELKTLMDKAATADDYQHLATYFHLQELLFRNKAQQALDQYARQNGKYPMATKTVSRADVASREYESCVSKADEDAKLAAHYDEILIGLGIHPTSISATTVSIDSLEKDSHQALGTALLDRSRSAGK